MKRVNKFLAILLMAGLCGNGTVGAVRITPKGQHAGLNGFDDKKAYTNGEQIVTSFKGNNPYKPKVLTYNGTSFIDSGDAEIEEDYSTEAMEWERLSAEAKTLGLLLATERRTLENYELSTAIAAKRATDALVPPRVPVTPPPAPVKPELLAFATANNFEAAGIHLTPADNGLTEENLRDLKTFLQEQSYSDGGWVYTTKLPDELRGHTATALVQHMREHKAALREHGIRVLNRLPQWLTAEQIAHGKACHMFDDMLNMSTFTVDTLEAVAAQSLAAYQAAKQALIDAGLGYADGNVNASWTTQQLKELAQEQINQSEVSDDVNGYGLDFVIDTAKAARKRRTYAEQLGVRVDQISQALDTSILEQLVLVEAALRPSAEQLKSMSYHDAQLLIQQDREVKQAARAVAITDCGYEGAHIPHNLTADMIKRLHAAGATADDLQWVWGAEAVDTKIAELIARKELADAVKECGYEDLFMPHGFTADMIRACKAAGLSGRDLYSVDPHNFESSLAAFKEQHKAQQKERNRKRKEAIKRAGFKAADVHESLESYEISQLSLLGITPTQEITQANFLAKIAELQAAQRDAALKEVEAAGFDRAVIEEAEALPLEEIKAQLKKRLALVKELTRRGINPDTVVEKAREGEADSHDLLLKNQPAFSLKMLLDAGVDGSDMPTAEDITKGSTFEDVVRPKIEAKLAALRAADEKLKELDRQLTEALGALEAKEDGEDAAPDADVFADVRKAFDAFMKDEYAKTPKFGTGKSALKSTLVTGEHDDETLGDRDEVYVAGDPFEYKGMVYPGVGHLEPRRFEKRGLLSKLEWNIKVLERQLISDADMKAFNAKQASDAHKAPEIPAEERAKLEKQHNDLVALRDAWYDVVYPAIDGKEDKNAGKKLDRHAAATLLARLARGKAGREKAKREKELAKAEKEDKRKETLKAKFALGRMIFHLAELEKAKPANETSEEFKTWKKDRDALLKGKARLEKMIADATPKTPAQVFAAEAELWANKAMALKVRAARYREIAQATTASERNQLRAIAKSTRDNLRRKDNVLRDRLYELREKRTVANMLEKDIAALEAKIKANDDRLERFDKARKKAKQATSLDDAAYADLAKLVQETADELDAQAAKCRKHSSSMNKSWTVAQVAKVDAAIIGAALILQNILEGYAGELPADEDKRTTGQKVKEALAAILSVQRYVNSLKAFGRVFVPAKRGKKAPGFGSRLKTFGKEKTMFATGLGAATAFTGYVGAQAAHKKWIKA